MGSDFVFAEKESKVIIFYLISFTQIIKIVQIKQKKVKG